ncbi:MAG: hypothetical protein JEZ00_04190 [Anaerolineaceae bacterium]|nr:hypothetical protein [Anaerolineaceae bacterium]
MQVDIQTAVQTAFVLSIIGFLGSLFYGLGLIRNGRKILYYHKRQSQMTTGWWYMALSLAMGLTAWFLHRQAEPVLYQIFPPSPTITITSTITQTTTITLTPTTTLSPTVTNTPEITYTPQIPVVVSEQFVSTIEPAEDVVFSPLIFARTIDENNQAVSPVTTFQHPVTDIFGVFSYDKMNTGVQWSSVWVRLSDQEVICYETKPWDASTGGYGYTDCHKGANSWLPGEYDVQIYIGMTWISSGKFTIVGDPPTATFTPSPSYTPSNTPTASRTPTATHTRTPTTSATITKTPTASNTPTRTKTKTQTFTPNPTDTRWPSPTVP